MFCSKTNISEPTFMLVHIFVYISNGNTLKLQDNQPAVNTVKLIIGQIKNIVDHSIENMHACFEVTCIDFQYKKAHTLYNSALSRH